MNLYDLNSDNVIMNIDGIDIEMKHPICFGKEYDRWLVSRCGKVWSMPLNKLLRGYRKPYYKRGKSIQNIDHQIHVEEDWWGDGSGHKHCNRETYQRHIPAHKMIIDTWAPLYDNPPVGIVWEEWEIVRDLPSVYNHISKTVCIDHIDDNKKNNHLDNLRRLNQWDNNPQRKTRGI